MKEIQVIPTSYPLPQSLSNLPSTSEAIIDGRPYRKFTTTLQSLEHPGLPVYLWVEEGQTNPFIDLITQLNLVSRTVPTSLISTTTNPKPKPTTTLDRFFKPTTLQ
ncbi:hypothetical protein NEHOM01_0463 [Nematocida homosporus]|uniref:uncharacterized protein n=1 Tax=Nematocida homosporus TaxID=1912981 RepID=UPI002220FD83|nr:uncharacterized protein NEHOM01_0463 [Nematocida homosporus]KAI5184912.1 hypothetical protein NEHOM01_0463 [Nematocida homosporus]